MSNSELFWNASTIDLKRGYLDQDKYFTCLLCGKEIEKGIIYSDSGMLYEAEKFIEIHILKAHHSVFEYLINLDKRLTGLTDHQRKLLNLFYQGKNNSEIQKEMNIGSVSTIRNHRFQFKERERQSKLFLVLMEILKEKDQFAPVFVPLHKNAKIVDQRYNITEEEKEKIIKNFFSKGTIAHLKAFPAKEKYKLVILREFAFDFEKNRKYDEKEVNEIIKNRYPDFVTIRRYLIEYGFMERKPDGSEYWLKEGL